MAPFRPKKPELMSIQDEINNLDKQIKYMQSPVKIMPFYSLPHYKSI